MRTRKSLMDAWTFKGPSGQAQSVTLPHTWNNLDGQDGGNDYIRGCYDYSRNFDASDFDASTQEAYLVFEGVNASATVILNGSECAVHHGGYSRFRVKVSSLLQADNALTVKVDNSVNNTVYPQKADFTFYGGIYRDVYLLVVSKTHFDLEHEGGPGLKVTPVRKDGKAEVALEAYLVGDGTVTFCLLDDQGSVVAEGTGPKATLTIQSPRLWHGKDDPYLYQARAQLLVDGAVTDEVTLPFGVRSFYVDKDKGFFLNDKPYPLYGVSRHQDRRALGNALSTAEHDEDLALIEEVGANCIRLAHYQHDPYFYDLCDQKGYVIWAEIPYISEHMPEGRANTISQMRELIIQNYHRPSIFFWGISNEITISTKDKQDMLDNHHVLNDLTHEMDPTRKTVLACYAMCGPFNKVAHITDLVGWNLYLGWYVPGLFLNDWWISFFHLCYPKRSLSFSEYGCEGMPNLHSEHPKRGDHTEEYQAIYHEFMLRCFERHPYMFANYVWNMFDFAADARDQGGEAGMNHKGLVTFDRKTKKDAFYLYKAFWSKEPFVHIAGKRMVDRVGPSTTLRIYSNQKEVTLYKNGEFLTTLKVDRSASYELSMDADCTIEAKAGTLEDKASFKRVDKPNPDYILKKDRNKQKSNWV